MSVSVSVRRTAGRIKLFFGTEASYHLFYTVESGNLGISKNKGTFLWNFVPSSVPVKRTVACSSVCDRCVLGYNKRSPYSITERRVPKLIPVLGSQPAGDVSHKPGGRLPLLSTRPAVTLATLKRAATNFVAL